MIFVEHDKEGAMSRRKGRKWGVINEFCSRCDEKRDNPNKRYCKKCNAAYIREWRKTHPLSEEQKIKAIVRNKTMMRIKRGLLIRYPCEVCGDTKVEAHHDDYSKTYDVRWLCFKHHREHHKLNQN